MRKANIIFANQEIAVMSVPPDQDCELCGMSLDDSDYEGEQDGIVVYCGECGHANFFADDETERTLQ
jgi:Zn finger protein HypA/HybF involved in hydrogenase expression